MTRAHRPILFQEQLSGIRGAIRDLAANRPAGQDVAELKTKVATLEDRVDHTLPGTISVLGDSLRAEIGKKAVKEDTDKALAALVARVDALEARGCRFLARNFFDHLHLILQVGMMAVAGESQATSRKVPGDVIERIQALDRHSDYIALQDLLKGSPAGGALQTFSRNPCGQGNQDWKALANELDALWDKIAKFCDSRLALGPKG